MPKAKAKTAEWNRVVAMSGEQIRELWAYHHKLYAGEYVINCPACLHAQTAIIEGKAGDESMVWVRRTGSTLSRS